MPKHSCQKVTVSKGGSGGRASKGHNHSDTKLVCRKRSEKAQRAEQREHEAVMAAQAYAEEMYWQPVDKVDQKHKLKLKQDYEREQARLQKINDRETLRYQEETNQYM